MSDLNRKAATNPSWFGGFLHACGETRVEVSVCALLCCRGGSNVGRDASAIFLHGVLEAGHAIHSSEDCGVNKTYA